MGCLKAGDVKPYGIDGGTTTSSGVTTTTTIVRTCNIKIENEPSTNQCVSGGVFPNVAVEFRPNQNYLGKFGFDWVRVGDSGLTPSQADILYTDNMGYYNEPDGTKNKTTRGDTFYSGSFITDGIKSTLLSDSFKLLDNRGAMNNMQTNMQSDFPDYEYIMPVITLMPKDIVKNPHNVGLEGVLDVIVKTGSIAPSSLKLRVRSEFDEQILNDAFTFSSNNIPLSSKKDVLKICSKGILEHDVTVYVYTEKCHMPCGAFKLLANNNVRNINMVLIGIETKLNPIIRSLIGIPNIDDITKVRTLLAQALISVDKVIDKNFDGTALSLDMTALNSSGHTKLNLASHGTPATSSSSLAMFDWDKMRTIFNLLEQEYQSNIATIQNPSSGELLVSGDAFRFYFLPDKCGSGSLGGISGGGSIGVARTAYFKTWQPKTTAETIVHEIGHNMGLRHTFNYDISHSNSYTYKYKSTDNIMDYSGNTKSVFYYWQWKIMNSGIN